MYFFKSSHKDETRSQISVLSNSFEQALIRVSQYFTNKGFIGKPIQISFIIGALMCISSINCYAAKNDTLAVNNNLITKVIKHKTTNTKGKEIIKYYFVYNGNLISTSKTVVDKYELAKAYDVRIALIIIKNRRIALN
jgi:hypothetical protein